MLIPDDQWHTRTANRPLFSCPPRTSGHFACLAFICMFFFLAPEPAWAVQTHGGVEGLVSHQLAHSLFAIGMLYLLRRLRKMRFNGPGWAEFRAFLWLLIAWNVVTFSGHWLNEFVGPDQFIKVRARVVTFRLDTLSDGLYFLSRLDHLLLVPSFLCLLRALKKWRLQT